MYQQYLTYRKKWIGFNDKWIIIGGIPLVGYVMSFLFYEDISIAYNNKFSRFNCFLLGVTYTAIYWLTFTEWAIQIRKRYFQYSQNITRLTLTGLGILILYFAMEEVIIKIIKSILLQIPLSDVPVHPTGPHTAGLIMSFLCLSIYENIYYHKQLQDTILEKEQLAQANLKSELAGLRSQINPHFFFNSLNTLMDIVSEDATLATKYIQNLSKIFRYVLDASKHQLVTVKEELDFIKSFSFILLERFKGNLEIQIEVPDDCESCHVPPMSLQMLIENAIKHNVISSAHPLKIEIYVDDEEYLIVKNNLQLKTQIHGSTGIGLENIKRRYQYLTNKPVIHSSGNNNYVVMLPIIITNHKIIEMYEGTYN
jgi:two-component system, LytTR family, sensor kinase